NLHILSDALAADRRGYALIRSLSGVIATKEAFETAVLSAFQNADERDVSVLYISTHGVFEDGLSIDDAALLLSDGITEERLDTPFLQRVLDQIPGTKLLILDACNSGAMIGKGLSGGADRSYFTGKDYKVLCSAGGSEASWYFQHGAEEAVGGASYFAAVLSCGLGLKGDYGADRNADGNITLSEASDYLRQNYAASTPQCYPENDGDFVLFSYDPLLFSAVEQAITDITFEETLLTAGESQVTFSFTVQRQVELYYQIVYHQDGQWQFDSAQHFLDGEQADGTVLPGRKMRTLSLNTGGEDAYGYAIVQLITMEQGRPEFQGARLICVRPNSGEIHLNALTGSSFVPALGQELAILVQHDKPCGLTVNILDENGKLVRRLCYDAPTRPQQLIPAGSAFYWDGKTNTGEWAAEGTYSVQVKTRLNGQSIVAQSAPFFLLSNREYPDHQGENP
ncbi:MAG: CHAT domain-containing protein, partial [Clostridia bacterium]|nr:CHAT domain-containing protein [Clostridia bacterium]